MSLHAIQISHYDTAFLRAGRNLYCGCNSRFFAYGGVRWIETELRRNYRIQTTTLPVKYTERTSFDGGGIELGVGGEYGLGCGFNIVAQFGPILLLGNRNDTMALFESSVVAFDTSTKYPGRDFTKCVPGMDVRTGINYAYDWSGCGCSLRLVGELGWEVDYYWNMWGLRSEVANDENLSQAAAVPTNFGTNGFYASLAVRF